MVLPPNMQTDSLIVDEMSYDVEFAEELSVPTAPASEPSNREKTGAVTAQREISGRHETVR